jgi:hypothetical protein
MGGVTTLACFPGMGIFLLLRGMKGATADDIVTATWCGLGWVTIPVGLIGEGADSGAL